MMRTLAEFIMRGRMQAAMMAVLGYVVPMLTPLVIALVTLRRGAADGALLLLISLVPAMLALWVSDSSSLLVWMTLLSLVAVFIPAVALRATVSLPTAIVACLGVAAVLAILVVNLTEEQIRGMLASFMDQLAQQDDSERLVAGFSSITGIAGLLAYFMVINAVLGLLLGRWLQSMLYNPGGFAEEFQSLRLAPVLATGCFAASIYCRLQGGDLSAWSNVMAVPLLLVAMSVGHSIARQRQWATPWLVLFYIAVFFFSPLFVVVGFMDTWLNFRRRFGRSNHEGDDGDSDANSS